MFYLPWSDRGALGVISKAISGCVIVALCRDGGDMPVLLSTFVHGDLLSLSLRSTERSLVLGNFLLGVARVNRQQLDPGTLAPLVVNHVVLFPDPGIVLQTLLC